MRTTDNLGLKLTGNTAEDTIQTFQTWRNGIDGYDAGSNMNLIDTAYGSLRQDVANSVASLMDSAGLGVIPYAVNGSFAGTSSTGGISYVQDGNRVTVNGKSTATAAMVYTTISLTGVLGSWYRSATKPDISIRANTTLISGHTYKITADIISGTRTDGGGATSIRVGLSSANGEGGSYVTIGISDSHGELRYVGDGGKYAMYASFGRLMTVTNLVIEIKLTDLTESENIARSESTIASTNYAVGDLMTIDGKLYRATNVITTGDALASGTNIAETSISAELKRNATLVATASLASMPTSWTNINLDVPIADVIDAAERGNAVIKLVMYSGSQTVYCRPSDHVVSGSNTLYWFMGLSIDNVLYVYNVKLTPAGAQAFVAGTIPMDSI